MTMEPTPIYTTKTNNFLYFNLIKMTKNDLFNYLDGFNFFSQNEVIKAVCEFIKENGELTDVENSIFGKRVYVGSLADDYISEKQLFHLPDFLD